MLRLLSFNKKHDILNPNQFGFRPGSNCVDVVKGLTEEIWTVIGAKVLKIYAGLI